MSAVKMAMLEQEQREERLRDHAVSLAVHLSRAVAWGETSDLGEDELYWLKDARDLIDRIARGK